MFGLDTINLSWLSLHFLGCCRPLHGKHPVAHFETSFSDVTRLGLVQKYPMLNHIYHRTCHISGGYLLNHITFSTFLGYPGPRNVKALFRSVVWNSGPLPAIQQQHVDVKNLMGEIKSIPVHSPDVSQAMMVPNRETIMKVKLASVGLDLCSLS